MIGTEGGARFDTSIYLGRNSHRPILFYNYREVSSRLIK